MSSPACAQAYRHDHRSPGTVAVPSPERARRLTKTGAAGALATGLALAHLPTYIGVPCPILTLTGIPCPFCGMTTSVRNTLGLRFRLAAGANPFGFLVVAACAAVLLVPWATWARLFARLPRRLLPSVGATLLTGSWLFELARYHIV